LGCAARDGGGGYVISSKDHCQPPLFGTPDKTLLTVSDTIRRYALPPTV
jgi:hypothetical protein